MNAFYKVKAILWDKRPQTNYSGVTVGTDEGDIMNKIVAYYGRENIEQISFWFGEFCDEDVVEIEDFEACPLFDFNKKS